MHITLGPFAIFVSPSNKQNLQIYICHESYWDMLRQRKVFSPERSYDTEQILQWHEGDEGATEGGCTGTEGSAAPRAVLLDILSQAELKESLVLETVPANHSFTGYR